MIEQGDLDALIQTVEALHEKKIAQISDAISADRDRIKVVLIAGPSASGKTTFAQRLLVQLRVNGLNPVPISLDDYFVDRAMTPRAEDGEHDFESLDAIDLALFNDHLVRLVQGEEVEMPVYDFVAGRRRSVGRTIRLGRDQMLIIEGIHGLNDRLTASIPMGRKYKIYVSALTHLNIDDHNRIPTTDVRILRRLVRDHLFRGHSAVETLRRWPRVRAGEESNIFLQESADIMVNTALAELAALRPHAEPLEDIQPEHRLCGSQRLRKFLTYHSRPADGCPRTHNAGVHRRVVFPSAQTLSGG